MTNFFITDNSTNISHYAEPEPSNPDSLYPDLKSDYIIALNDSGVGFIDDTYEPSYVKYQSNVFGGTWASRQWTPPYYTFAKNNVIAAGGTAPLPRKSWTTALPSNAQVGSTSSSNPTYMCLTFYNNNLYVAYPTSATVPDSSGFTPRASTLGANVVIITLCAGGGGGGGGWSNNGALKKRRAHAGSGGGGGAWARFIYKFDINATSGNKTVLCFTIGSYGKKGSVGSAGTSGGDTTVRLNSFSGSLLCKCGGGQGGSAGEEDVVEKAGGIGGRVSDTATNSTTFYLVQSISGGQGGTAYGKTSGEGSSYGGDGKNAGGGTSGPSFSFSPVCNSWTPTKQGEGQDGVAPPTRADGTSYHLSYGGGGGGASAQSRAHSKNSGFGDVAVLGLGGNGGSAHASDTSAHGVDAAEDGGPGFAYFEHTYAVKI